MQTMDKSWIPRFLRPDFTWPRPMRTLSEETPAIPKVTHPLVRRFWGFIHRYLARFSHTYSYWFGLYPAGIYSNHELPFGLILKWSTAVRIEEVIAMQMARAAGMPVPKVLCYGEHPGMSRRVSILMTRLPGDFPVEHDKPFDPKVEVPWVNELGRCLKVMRAWRPNGWSNESRICSVMGTQIHSFRVPFNIMGPFETETELHDFLLSTSSSHAFKSKEEYEKTVSAARKIYTTMPHRICFTHGDLQCHNILVDEHGSLSGFLDWDSAGWLPDYWEFSTIMKHHLDSPWWQAMSFLGGHQYLEEMYCDRALHRLTVDSII